MFTKEEYTDWRGEKVTKTLIKAITENRVGRLEEIADGKVEGNELYRELGRIQGILDVIVFLTNQDGLISETLIVETDDNEKASA